MPGRDAVNTPASSSFPSQNEVLYSPRHLPRWYTPPRGHQECDERGLLPAIRSGIASAHEQIVASKLCVRYRQRHHSQSRWYCEMVEERSARLLYLPLYPLDFNPIEPAFPKIKEWLHTNHDLVNQELETGTAHDVFSKGVRSVTEERVKGWYKDCGYNVLLCFMFFLYTVHTINAFG